MKGKEMPEDVEFNMADWMRRFNRELPESPASVRCWQPGEVEVEDRWGIGSMSSRSEPCCAPGHDRFDILKKSKSRQLHGSRRSLHRAGRRVFLCFRRSTINLTVPDLEPSASPKSGPLTAPRTSVSGALNGVNTFMDDAIDHHHHHTDSNKDGKDAEEPTSPVVNCMGQVKNKKVPKHAKKTTEHTVPNSDMDRFRRTKSQAPRESPPRVQKSASCKWKQLLRSNSSSISPSNQPIECEGGEPEIDLGRFSSASGSSDPFYHDGPPKPDKTCMFMQRNNNNNNHNNNNNNGAKDDDDVNKLFQEQMNARNAAEPVQFRNLPKLKTRPIESPKWLVDEPAFDRRLHKPSRIDIKSSSTRSSSHT